jgi:hypothetical protein
MRESWDPSGRAYHTGFELHRDGDLGLVTLDDSLTVLALGQVNPPIIEVSPDQVDTGGPPPDSDDRPVQADYSTALDQIPGWAFEFNDRRSANRTSTFFP